MVRGSWFLTFTSSPHGALTYLTLYRVQAETSEIELKTPFKITNRSPPRGWSFPGVFREAPLSDTMYL